MRDYPGEPLSEETLTHLTYHDNFASFAVPLFTDFNAVVCAKKSDKLGFMLKDYRSFKVNRV